MGNQGDEWYCEPWAVRLGTPGGERRGQRPSSWTVPGAHEEPGDGGPEQAVLGSGRGVKGLGFYPRGSRETGPSRPWKHRGEDFDFSEEGELQAKNDQI